MTSITLKPGKEKAILNRHHWIFSGALQTTPSFENGSILAVYSHKQELLGHAYFNKQSGIIGRMVSFGPASPQEQIKKNINAAISLRETLFLDDATTAYRLINGEGDRLPGLVVDRYGSSLVLQIGTLGMEKLKHLITDHLIKRLNPKHIYEKSTLPSRREEGLPPVEKNLYGSLEELISIKENGLDFYVSPANGQKTGFFLDQRNMRAQVRSLSKGKRILNCFSYTGGFSVYALAGHARQVDSVDVSAAAMELTRKNIALNGFSERQCGFFAEDAFEFLKKSDLSYDLVILDPPAFAKKQKDVIAACRGYKEINRQAIQKMPSGSLLITCSCSYHVDENLFQKVIFQASSEANRNVRILGRHLLSPDHPINIHHPETDYLKSLLLYIG